jgi:hypothetical protein
VAAAIVQQHEGTVPVIVGRPEHDDHTTLRSSATRRGTCRRDHHGPAARLDAFSVLLVPLEQLLQTSRSELASVFGISAVFFTIDANVTPWLFGRVSAALLVALTGALCALGVILAAVAPSLGWSSSVSIYRLV